MTFLKKSEVLYIFNTLFLAGLYAASLPYQDQAKFAFSSIIDAAIPIINPTGSSKCETLKSFLGVTYEQMQNKNSTNFDDLLNIDLVTKNGNVKYNMSAYKRLYRVMRNAAQVVILIHGFMESSDGLMVQGIAPEFLKKPCHKIFALDGKKMFGFEYFSSSTYARFMGEKLGTLLSRIIKRQDPSKITLIGHSLGAHIAGVAGKQVIQLVDEPISRIVGLDPAAPCFSHVDLAGRLDRTDAEYVDVIHTNAGMLGLEEPVGHKDFYPNGGESQPGCYLYTCHHSRAWELFAESVNSPEKFPARKCGNWTKFQEGRCAKKEVAYMGISSEFGSPGTYILTTGSAEPFGLGAAGSG